MATPMTEVKLKERLMARPDSLAFSRLADLYRKSGNITQAIDLCVRGVEKHPDYVTGRIILGRCYLEQENLDKAVEAFVGVCSIDERNIVALKMLGDIFMRQGFHEKAGDCFLLLAGIDPYNDMLARSAAQTKGSGKRNIRDILGITVSRQPDSATAIPPSESRAAETIPTPAGTQIATPQELGITPPAASPVAATVDSKAATELSADIDIDEVLAEATEITGSDITERMTKMFGGEDAAEPIPEAQSVPEPEPAPKTEAKTVGETPVGGETIEVEPLTEVPDGTTITARIDEMFGKDTIRMPAIKEVPREPAPAEASEIMVEELLPPNEAAFEETMIMDADAMKLKEDSGITIKPVSDRKLEEPATESKDNLGIDGLVADDMVESIEKTAGNYIVDEQDSVEDLFKGIEEPDDKASSASLPEEKEPSVADLIVSPETDSGSIAEDTISGDDVKRRIEQMLENKSEEPSVADLIVTRETDSGPAAEETISGDDVKRRIEQMLENKSPESAGGSADSDKPDTEDTISGDDVKRRIEQMLENKSPEPVGSSIDLDKPDSGDRISGDDVKRRIEEMLEKKSTGPVEAPRSADADTPVIFDTFELVAEKTEEAVEPSDDSEAAVMELVTDDDSTMPAFPVSPASVAAVTDDDGIERIDEIFEKKSDKEAITVAPPEPTRVTAMDETSASSKFPAAEETISGDDVVERIEAVFEKKDKENMIVMPEVSLGRSGLAGVDTDSEATVVFERDEKPASRRAEPLVDRETLDEASFEIKKPAAAEDETSESSKPGVVADAITGKDVAERLEGMFEKKDEPATFEPPATASESTGTATEAIDDTALSSDSVIETVGILTGNDVEDRLNDMFNEAMSAKDNAEEPPASPEKQQPVEKEDVFEPIKGTIEEFEETLISSDIEPLLPGTAKKETAPVFPAERDKAVDDESSALGELEEMLEAHRLDDESLKPEAAKTHLEAIETGVEQTAVFEDFTPGSVPEAPPPAPDVPLFLTGKDTPVNSETILAEVGTNDSPYDLPDHVLTPTLADLYFQQGQPHLALSIYRRLLEKSGGENDKFKKRIGEIEKAVADGAAAVRSPAEQAAAPVPKPKKVVPAAPRSLSRAKKGSDATGEKLRPLSGVRLKKRPKIQWRKKAGEK